MLWCPANGPWSIPGVPGSPVHIRQNDVNPVNQVIGGVFNLKHLTSRAGMDAFISGLVLVMPHPRCSITLAKRDLPTGMDVLVGSLPELRTWFQGLARRKAFWTAEQAHAVLAALNYGHAVTIADLAAQGFTSEHPATPTPRPAGPTSGAALRAWLAGIEVSTGSAPPPRTPFRPAARQMPSLPPAWAGIAARAKQRSEARRRLAGNLNSERLADEVDNERLVDAAEFERIADDVDNTVYANLRYPISAPVSAPPFPERAPRRRWRPSFGSVAVVVLALVVAGGFWLVLRPTVHSSPRGTGTAIHTGATTTAPPPPQPPITLSAQIPTPPQPKTCYPMQPDC